MNCPYCSKRIVDMKFYITKYALSQGIKEVEGEVHPTIGNGQMLTREKAIGAWVTETYHGEGKDWHRTHAAAVAKAEAMRLAKISALNRQIAKLQQLKFV
jgi:hypothetical protein